MYKRFKERFGTAGVVIGVFALVMAMVTGAYAAGGGLSGKQKKEVEKIAKKYAGKDGAPGAAGANGTNGTNGKDGANGTNGKDGTNGTNATTVAFSGNEHGCPEGGVEVKSASAATYVCNGEEGAEGTQGIQGVPGPEGKPWTAGGTLPPGSTETGSWAFNGTTADTEGIRTPISFPIPYSFPLTPAHTHIGEENESGFVDICSGTASNPTAPPGELCVYYSEAEGLVNATANGIFRYNTVKGTTRTGAMLTFTPSAVAYGAGSFAITGCTETSPGSAVCTNYAP